MEEIAGAAVSATSLEKKSPNISGRKERPTVSIKPTNKAATKAPLMDPTPPITITTKVMIKIPSPIPISTVMIGPAIKPAKPASAAPRPKTIV